MRDLATSEALWLEARVDDLYSVGVRYAVRDAARRWANELEPRCVALTRLRFL